MRVRVQHFPFHPHFPFPLKIDESWAKEETIYTLLFGSRPPNPFYSHRHQTEENWIYLPARKDGAIFMMKLADNCLHPTCVDKAPHVSACSSFVSLRKSRIGYLITRTSVSPTVREILDSTARSEIIYRLRPESSLEMASCLIPPFLIRPHQCGSPSICIARLAGCCECLPTPQLLIDLSCFTLDQSMRWATNNPVWQTSPGKH